jgi:hypothetical protein
MKFLYLLLLACVLTACGGGPAKTPAPAAITPMTSGYPAPGTINVATAYPAGTAQQLPTDTPAPTPTVNADLGIVTGTLTVSGEPLQYANLFLAEMIKAENGQEIAAGKDPVTAPATQTDDKGKFRFINVKPGRYGLVYDVGVNSFLLLLPDNSNQAVIVEVTADKKDVDIGALNYPDLPKQ